MPNYFQFKDKDGEPIKISKLDDDLRELIGAEPDEDRCHPAFGYLQMAAAVGWSIDKMVEEAKNEAHHMALWMKDQGYTVDAWYMRR